MNEKQSPSLGPWGREELGFGTALLAAFVAGTVGGLAATLVARGSFNHETTLLLTQLVGVLIGSVALIVFLWFCDWSLSPLSAVLVMVVANAAPLVVTRALMQAEAHAISRTPTAVPVVGIGLNGIGAVVGIAIILGEAWLVQVLARPAPSRSNETPWESDEGQHRWFRPIGWLFAVLGVCALALWAGQQLWVKASRGANKTPTPLNGYAPTIAVRPSSGLLTPSQARRFVSRDGTARRDLSCRWYASDRKHIVCTYLASTNGELTGSNIAALLVEAASDGAVTETAVAPPIGSAGALVAAANRACGARTLAVAAIAKVPSLQQTARLIPIERRFEAALVHVGAVPGAGQLGPSAFLGYFLDYEQALIKLHRDVRANQPLNITQTDLGDARGRAASDTQLAQQIGINCDFRTYLQPPPAPSTANASSAKPRPTPRSSINAPQNNPGFTAAKATAILAANPNNIAIQCDPGANGWTYICSYLNAAQPHRTGFLAHGPTDGQPLAVTLPAEGPIPAPPTR